MAQSYTELRRYDAFDWNAFFTGEKDFQQICDARELTTSWATCPCGALPVEIPRGVDGRPKDAILAALGLRFTIEMEYPENLPAAYKLLAAIEARAGQIITSLNK